MTALPFHISNNSITVVLPDGPKTLSRSDKKYNDVVQAIKEQRWDDVPELIDVTKKIVNFSNSRFTVEGNTVLFDGKETSQAFSNKVLAYAEEGLPCEPLFKFWQNLKRNPSNRSVNQLFLFLDKNDHPLTEDGHFLAYKRVREDYLDCHSGSMDNSIGKVISMARNEVDDDPERTCSHGLHVANYEYAQQFYGGGRLLVVKVNPRDVVSVPVDYNNAKMRVCQYEVLSEVTSELREQYIPTNEVQSVVDRYDDEYYEEDYDESDYDDEEDYYGDDD